MADDVPRSEIVRSSRDPELLRARLEAWLSTRADSEARVTNLVATSANGMSSETVLFDAAWSGDTHERLVARLAPSFADVPVFPTYQLHDQFEVIRRVGELTTVPVPRVWWYEDDPDVVGTQFFVMSRVDGEVPPDVLPYAFGDNWLFDAAPDEQRRLQDATVDALADLHEIADAPRVFGFLEPAGEGGGTPLARKVARTRSWYEWVVGEGARSAVIDAALDWLESNLPSDEGPPVLSWGDSRIGNVMYRDFAPVAVLDWEMACLGPRELDVAWLVYSHQIFQELAEGYGLGGMPEFMRIDDVVSRYEARSGHAPRNVDYHLVLAAVQWAIVFVRTGQRSIHFGEREAPTELDEMVMNRASLERMLSAP